MAADIYVGMASIAASLIASMLVLILHVLLPTEDELRCTDQDDLDLP